MANEVSFIIRLIDRTKATLAAFKDRISTTLRGASDIAVRFGRVIGGEVGSAIRTATMAVNGFTAALAANPIGAVIIAVLALVAAFAKLTWDKYVKHTEDLTKATEKLHDAMKRYKDVVEGIQFKRADSKGKLEFLQKERAGVETQLEELRGRKPKDDIEETEINNQRVKLMTRIAEIDDKILDVKQKITDEEKKQQEEEEKRIAKQQGEKDKLDAKLKSLREQKEELEDQARMIGASPEQRRVEIEREIAELRREQSKSAFDAVKMEELAVGIAKKNLELVELTKQAREKEDAEREKAEAQRQRKEKQARDKSAKEQAAAARERVREGVKASVEGLTGRAATLRSEAESDMSESARARRRALDPAFRRSEAEDAKAAAKEERRFQTLLAKGRAGITSPEIREAMKSESLRKAAEAKKAEADKLDKDAKEAQKRSAESLERIDKRLVDVLEFGG